MKKKKTKKRANYNEGIPIDPTKVKSVVEVPFKQINPKDLEKVEKPGKIKKKTKKRTTKKKTIKTKPVSGKSTKIVEPVKRTGKGDYTLIITEKPQAANKIALALGTSKKITNLGVPYYEVSRDHEKIVVAAAAGHLFTLVQRTRGQKPAFDLDWVPSYQQKAAFTKKFYDVLRTLASKAKDFVVATDYDVEGEVIGWNILRYICGVEDAKRMKYSTLTTSELQESYNKLMKTIDWGQAIAGETRHHLDWMYGINLSRAIMSAIKTTGSFKIMSIGRVQGPTLKLIVDRELEIQNFKPTPFWDIYVIIEGLKLKHPKSITDKKELKKFEELKGKIANVKTTVKENYIKPPVPFDLTTLQTECYRYFRLTPAKTLQIAQKLYLDGLISYPRTSSQKIPDSANPKKILHKLGNHFSFVDNATRDKPVEGKKSDPAHPAIYPTGEFSSLIGDNQKVYELIVKRFVSCFCDDAVVKNKHISAIAEGLKFTTNGLEILKDGWMKVYPSSVQEKRIKDLNGEFPIEKVDIEEKETQPPHRYTPASIVSEMAKRNLGTKATRALIVETLYQRDYIQDQSIKATLLGITLINTLKKYSEIIVDEKLTREVEKETEQIVTAKKGLKEKEDKIIGHAKNIIIKIMKDFGKHEEAIGKNLMNVIQQQREQHFKESIIMPCPVCKKGDLRILYNKASRRYFVACSAYPECKTTYTLPPYGMMKKTDKTCDKCNWPLMMALQRGKRPWIFCFNPDCITRKQQATKTTKTKKTRKKRQ
jgi:DNA topoisomerase-1